MYQLRTSLSPLDLSGEPMFVYNPYEIGPYAAGMPTFTIPYADIQPYLTTTAQKLIEKQ